MLLAQSRFQVPECHPLHYLQMATEKLSKAFLLATRGSFERSHVAFSSIVEALQRRDTAGRMGWDEFKSYKLFLRRLKPLFREIEELHPDIGPRQAGGGPKDGPNVEYPWQVPNTHSDNWQAPATHNFALVHKLQRAGDYAKLIGFIENFLDRFDEVVRARRG